MSTKYKEDDVILCRVKKIEGTSVFLETEDGFPGSMILSEVAAGRIRNLRQYVSPNRKIVCKVLRVKSDHLDLSLRRVTGNERLDVLERVKKERAFANMLKLVGEKPDKIISEIKSLGDIREFMEKARADVKILEKLVGKEKADKLFKVLAEKEERDKTVEKKFSLMCDGEKGVKDIQDILDVKADIHYLGSSKFSVSVKAKDFKEAEKKMEEVLEELAKRAEKKKAKFKTSGK